MATWVSTSVVSVASSLGCFPQPLYGEARCYGLLAELFSETLGLLGPRIFPFFGLDCPWGLVTLEGVVWRVTW